MGCTSSKQESTFAPEVSEARETRSELPSLLKPHAEAESIVSRTSKRKSTPWHGKNSAGIGDEVTSHLSEEEEEEEEESTTLAPSSVKSAKQQPSVSFVEPIGNIAEAQELEGDLHRTSKRKATPWHSKADASSVVEFAGDVSEDQEVESDVVQLEGEEPPAERTSKRKATPWHGKGSDGPRVPSDLSSDEEDEDNAEERMKPPVVEGQPSPIKGGFWSWACCCDHSSKDVEEYAPSSER